MIDDLSKEQREQAIVDFEMKQQQKHRIGKMIIVIIAVSNIICSVISFIINFNIFSLIIQIALSVALFIGVTWVRYLFAIGSALGAILIFYIFFAAGVSLPAWAIIFFIFNLVFCIGSSILLFTSTSVEEFLYSQKNG